MPIKIHNVNRFKQLTPAGFRLLIAVLLLGLAADATAQTMRRNLTLLNYNIRNARGLDNVTDYDRIANIILQSGAETIALQELDSVTGRSQQVDVLKEIAARTGLHYTWATAIPYDGGKYGVGLLSREKPRAFYNIPLPGREEKRTLQVVEFQDYIMGNMHLSLTEADRMASIPFILAEAEKARKPFLLAGDFNAIPSSPFITELNRHFEILNDTAAYTSPAQAPRRTIDYIVLYRPTGKVKRARASVLNEPVASDHRPVWLFIKKLKRKK